MGEPLTQTLWLAWCQSPAKNQGSWAFPEPPRGLPRSGPLGLALGRLRAVVRVQSERGCGCSPGARSEGQAGAALAQIDPCEHRLAWTPGVWTRVSLGCHARLRPLTAHGPGRGGLPTALLPRGRWQRRDTGTRRSAGAVGHNPAPLAGSSLPPRPSSRTGPPGAGWSVLPVQPQPRSSRVGRNPG